MCKTRIKESCRVVIGIWSMTFRTLWQHMNVVIPFLIVGLANGALLSILYLAPRPPLSKLIAPPIRVIWGDMFLHYPHNFTLILKLFNYGNFITTTLIGVLMTGVAIGMLDDVKKGSKPGFLVNLVRAGKRYFRLLFIWLAMFIFLTMVFRGTGFYVSCVIRLIVTMLFVYAMPAALIEKKGWIFHKWMWIPILLFFLPLPFLSIIRMLPQGTSLLKWWWALVLMVFFFSLMIKPIKRSITFARKNLLPTVLLVVVPELIHFPLVILKGKIPLLATKFFPEIVLVVLTGGIIATVVLDCVITCSTTSFFLAHREEVYNGAE